MSQANATLSVRTEKKLKDQVGKILDKLALGSGVVLVCDEETCPVDFLLQILSFFEHESCGQCVPCRIGTSHLHYLIKNIASGTAQVSDIDLMIKKAEMMKQTALCALGQSPIMPIVTMLKYFREDFEKHCNHDFQCEACSRSLEAYYTKGSH